MHLTKNIYGYKKLAFRLFYIFCFIMLSFPAIYASDSEEEISVSTSKISIEELPEGSLPSVPKVIMPFKLGFEFQEGNSLCKWAEDHNFFQKKPIFFVKEQFTGRELWHLVIDTSDIEFVTTPFAYHERNKVEICMNNILLAVKSLQTLLERESAVRFENWIKVLDTQLASSPLKLEHSNLYEEVKYKTISRSTPTWSPRFMPQATIQHPLDFTIPLYFSLLGFDNPSYSMPFTASLPFLGLLRYAMQQGDSKNFDKIIAGYKSKVGGLIFLQALTMLQMTPFAMETDSELLAKTVETWTDYQQIDPKVAFILMSRRPFSRMLEEINFDKRQYVSFFTTGMSQNPSFTEVHNVPETFYKANYAEQFFHPVTERPVPATQILEYLKEEFVEENKDNLAKVLAQGIVSTTMLRNFKEEVKDNHLNTVANLTDNFYIETVKSVAFPKQRYIIDLKDFTIHSVKWDYDMLSPPSFLYADNSMGRLNQSLSLQERHYGDAIIEIRAIRNISLRFLKKVGIPPKKKGKFLVKAKESLPVHALKLFDFLMAFGTDEDDRDFEVGLSFAVVKHN